MTFTVFAKFSKWLFVLHILALFCTYWLIRNLNCANSHHASYGERSSNHHSRHWAQCVSSFETLRTVCIWDLQCFETFRNCCLLCTFWHIWNFYCGEAHHPNYTKHSLNLHFQHCAHCVYDIYSIFKVFEMAVCFAHIGLFEIWTALILTMLAMVNVVQIIISDIAHSVYLRFTVFWNFSKLLFVLHILAYSKFLLRWGASC